MSDVTHPLPEQKHALRQATLARRRLQPEKDRLSGLVWQTLFQREEYRRAAVVMSYVGVRDELRTQPFLPRICQEGKTLVVPYCLGERLGLFRLETLEELVPSTLGLLEPSPELRDRPDRQVPVAALDLVLVPGVAFDRQGERLGHGRGYYDRILPLVRVDAVLVGLAFECQMVPRIPKEAHDVALDLVITEQAVYCGQGRPRG